MSVQNWYNSDTEVLEETGFNAQTAHFENRNERYGQFRIPVGDKLKTRGRGTRKFHPSNDSTISPGPIVAVTGMVFTGTFRFR